MKKAVLSLLCLIFLYGSCIALAENAVDNEIIVNYDKNNTKGMDKNITTFDNVVESETGNVDNTANNNIIVDNNDINTVVSVANDATANKTDGDVNINGDAILTETISVKNEAVESIINDDEKQNQYKDKGIITNISADDIKTDEGRLFVSKFNFGSDFYFAFGGNMFTTITGVESYKKNNRLYSIGWDISLSWHVGGGVHIFTAFGWQIDMFDKITAGVARNKISPDINFYGRFGIKYIMITMSWQKLLTNTDLKRISGKSWATVIHCHYTERTSQ